MGKALQKIQNIQNPRDLSVNAIEHERRGSRARRTVA
jgi:hypothetical protein